MENRSAESDAAADADREGGIGRMDLIPLSKGTERRKIAPSDMNEYSAPRSTTASGNAENKARAESAKASSSLILLSRRRRNMKASKGTEDLIHRSTILS